MIIFSFISGPSVIIITQTMRLFYRINIWKLFIFSDSRSVQSAVVKAMSESFDLILQFSDQLVLGIILHVHHWLVVDRLGGVSILQSAQSLLEVGIRW